MVVRHDASPHPRGARLAYRRAQAVPLMVPTTGTFPSLPFLTVRQKPVNPALIPALSPALNPESLPQLLEQ